MKRRIALILCIVMAVACFTGCMYGEDHIVINEDGSGQILSRMEFEKSAVDQFAESMGMTTEELGIEGAVVETVDGSECYVVEETKTFSSLDELKKDLEDSGYTGVYVSKNGIRYLVAAEVSAADAAIMEENSFDLGESMRIRMLITMPKKIIKTTGTLSEDKMTAEFYFEGSDFYENQDIVVSVAKETTKPTISGATDKKTYNSARTITAKDASGIQKVQYKYKSSADGTYGKYKKTEFPVTFTQNGVYTVRAYDYYGNKTVKTFTIKDTRKPTVEGVKNKKTYYGAVENITISDNCKVKSVTYYVDGKKVETSLSDVLENGIDATEKGTHKITVTDVNSNKQTVTFKIK